MLVYDVTATGVALGAERSDGRRLVLEKKTVISGEHEVLHACQLEVMPRCLDLPQRGLERGQADVCLATRSAARTFDLHFIPLRSERYDLVMRRQTAGLPSVAAFLDILQRATLRRKLEVLAGYDTSETGALVA